MSVNLEPLYDAMQELKKRVGETTCNCNLRGDSEETFWLVCERKDNGLIEPERGKTIFLDYYAARKHAVETGMLIHEVVFKQVDVEPKVIDPAEQER